MVQIHSPRPFIFKRMRQLGSLKLAPLVSGQVFYS